MTTIEDLCRDVESPSLSAASQRQDATNAMTFRRHQRDVVRAVAIAAQTPQPLLFVTSRHRGKRGRTGDGRAVIQGLFVATDRSLSILTSLLRGNELRVVHKPLSRYWQTASVGPAVQAADLLHAWPHGPERILDAEATHYGHQSDRRYRRTEVRSIRRHSRGHSQALRLSGRRQA